MEITTIKPFLEEFYSVAEAYIEGDDPTTTFCSCGAVLLAAILAETSSVDVLTKITGFPACFVEAVLRVMGTGGYHFSLQFADLINAVCLHADDFKTIEITINDVMENYWARMDPIWCEAFEVLRGGCLFGGRRQWWIDVEEGLQLFHEQCVN